MGTVVAIRHVPFEDLGLLAPLLADRGHGVHILDAPTDDLTPARHAELVVILGGPISANDTADYPFLETEIALAAERLGADRPIIGLCLGAQIMARALGAPVYPSDVKEIGWAPLDLTPAGQESPMGALAAVPVLHWHGETFELPPGAIHLASTPDCAHQAFALGRHGLALQFHAEAGTAGLEPWFVGHTLEIAQTPGVDVPTLRADTVRFGPGLVQPATRFFSAWLEAAGL